MDHITDYIKWMGGLSFREKPFDTLDALVFCQLSYLIMTPLFGTEASDARSSFTISEIADYFRAHPKEMQIAIAGGDPTFAEFLDAVGKSRRFGNILVTDYVDIFEQEDAVQFGAMTFRNDGNDGGKIACKDDASNVGGAAGEDDKSGRTGADAPFSFLAFRGTDNSIAGWKEDFMISFTRIKSQDLAAEYVRRHIHEDVSRSWYIGGHSKGGNLALYAAVSLPAEQFDLLTRGYILDGPGFCPEVLDVSQVARVEGKLTRIIPGYSIIGMLFAPAVADTTIVQSSSVGILQHAISSWGVDHGQLLTAKGLEPQSVWLNHALDLWITDKTLDQRKHFVNEFFDALSAGNAKEFTDITAKGPYAMETVVLKLLGASPETRRIAADFPVRALYGNSVDVVKKKAKAEKVDVAAKLHDHQVLTGLALIAAGAVVVLLRNHIMGVFVMLAAAALTITEIVITLIRIARDGWKIREERTRIWICILLAVMTTILFLKEDAIFILGSLLFGSSFLFYAYMQGAKAYKEQENRFRKGRFLFEMVFSIILGVSYLIIPSWTQAYFAMSAGIFLALDGMLRIMDARREKRMRRR